MTYPTKALKEEKVTQVPILPKDVISDKSPQRGKGDASPYTFKGCDIRKNGDAQRVATQTKSFK